MSCERGTSLNWTEDRGSGLCSRPMSVDLPVGDWCWWTSFAKTTPNMFRGRGAEGEEEEEERRGARLTRGGCAPPSPWLVEEHQISAVEILRTSRFGYVAVWALVG